MLYDGFHKTALKHRWVMIPFCEQALSEVTCPAPEIQKTHVVFLREAISERPEMSCPIALSLRCGLHEKKVLVLDQAEILGCHAMTPLYVPHA